ncbi:MFS transporter [Candidatus Poribacteria bacterium]|nr:MFS transporter [Candidatus Poribacteria bacterium]
MKLHLSSTFTAFKHRNFQLWWLGQMVSLVGTWMQTVALGWLVYQLTNSPLSLGLVGFFQSLPVLLLSLFGGVVADRTNKRALIVCTQTAAMLLAFVLSALTFSGMVHIQHLFLVAFCLGIVQAFDMPARQAFVVEMVGKEDLMNAIALNSTIFNGARILGPAVAGALVAVVGVGWCFFLNGVSFLAVIAGLLFMRFPKSRTVARQESVWANLAEGLKYIVRSPIVLTLESLVAVASLFGMPYARLMPVFAKDVLQVGAHGYGFLFSATGSGALMGALLLASLGNFQHKGWLVTAGNLLYPVMLLAFSFSRWFPLSLVFLVGVGFSMITQNATTNTLLQMTVPDHLRGRVMSVHAIFFGGLAPFGDVLAGTVASFSSAPTAVGLDAAIALSYSLFVLLRLPQVRRLS